MEETRITPFLIKGGLVGLVIPLVLFAAFFVLTKLNIALGEHFLSATLIFTVALIELPVVIVGRLFGMPIESGGPAFIILGLNWLGYTLVLTFWISFGLLVGAVIGVNRRSSV